MLRSVLKYWAGVKQATTPRSVDYGEELIIWDFRKKDAVKHWRCICDSDVKGLSRAKFEANGKGTGAVFQGILNTEIPMGTNVKYSGYCAIRSNPKKKKWFGSDRVDMSVFDGFQLRVKGDGRKYMVNVQSPGLARKDDVWQCFLFTRGGPEWENIMLPFREFFLTHRGYMQDHQMSFPLHSMYTFGLLLVDRTNGPFRLEIQHIKAVRSILEPPPVREKRKYI